MLCRSNKGGAGHERQVSRRVEGTKGLCFVLWGRGAVAGGRAGSLSGPASEGTHAEM